MASAISNQVHITQPAIKPRWDIFCKIVDNFGDIGVCWRLSMQLANNHGLAVRLFIDDFCVASKIIPNLAVNKQAQVICGVEINAWPTENMALPEAVIENFSCQLPEIYTAQIHAQFNAYKSNRAEPINPIIWLNLEYLSAETWVGDCHAMPSTHPTSGFTKYFFFPGFVSNTGGLLREHDLIARRDTFLNTSSLQENFWRTHTSAYQYADFANTIKISLFSYPQADIKALISTLATAQQKITVFLPFNSEITALNQIIKDFSLTLGEVKQMDNLTLHLLPFLSQTEYDQLLWACDLNFVRGEDSWIRAIWAGKPFIWQPYIQEQEAHIKKLDAFLTVYTKNAEDSIKQLVQESHHIWSNASGQKPISTAAPKNFWLKLMQVLPTWQIFSLQQSNLLASQLDLSTQLVTFCTNLKVKNSTKNTV